MATAVPTSPMAIKTSAAPTTQRAATESVWNASIVSKFIPSRDTAMSWINTAAHIGAFIAESLAHILLQGSLFFLSVKTIVLFPPSILIVLPGYIALGYLLFDAINDVFRAAHTSINHTIK